MWHLISYQVCNTAKTHSQIIAIANLRVSIGLKGHSRALQARDSGHFDQLLSNPIWRPAGEKEIWTRIMQEPQVSLENLLGFHSVLLEFHSQSGHLLEENFLAVILSARLFSLYGEY